MNEIFLGILLVASVVLVVFLIIIAIKLLYTIDKTNIILTDIEKKLKTVDGVFNTIDVISNSISTISDSLITKLLIGIEKIFRKNKEEEE